MTAPFVTIFRDKFGNYINAARPMDMTEVERVIRDARPVPEKDALPLLKFAKFGSRWSKDKNGKDRSLRHDNNVDEVTGLAGDYDGEQMSMEAAIDRVKAAGAEALFYTSASHTTEKPRWRVLCPLAKALTGDTSQLQRQHRHHVGVLNALLGGVLQAESFTLSQAYFFGRITGRPDPQIVRLEGKCIDALANPPEPVPAKPKATLGPDSSAGHDAADERDETTDEELRAAFPCGEGRYLAMRSLSSRWAARAMGKGDIAATLRGLLELSPEGPLDPHVLDLHKKVWSLAETAVRRYGESRRQSETASVDPVVHIFSADRAPLGLQSLLVVQPLDPFVVEGILPTDVGTLVAPGGSGKSTWAIYEAVHIILGMPLLERRIVRSGSVLFLTAEDTRRRIEHRAYHICEELQLNGTQRELVGSRLLIEDLAGASVRLVALDDQGNLQRTPFVDALIEEYRGHGVVLINIDPMNYFGPGERHVNDGEAAMMQVGMRIVRETGAAVRYIHHTGKGNARDKATDQYAGRGGSALADNGRFTQVLQRLEGIDEKKKSIVPAAFTDDDFEHGAALAFSVPKVTDAPPVMQPIYLRRRGWSFEVVPVEGDAQVVVDQRDLAKLLAFVRKELESGVKHNPRSLEGRKEAIGFSRDRMRTLVHLGLAHEHLRLTELPKAEQRGAKKEYLQPTGREPAETPPSAPAPKRTRQPKGEDWEFLNALVRVVTVEQDTLWLTATDLAELCAKHRIAVPGGEPGDESRKVIGGIMSRIFRDGVGVQTVHALAREGEVPVKVTIERAAGQPGGWQYRTFTGDEPPPEDM